MRLRTRCDDAPPVPYTSVLSVLGFFHGQTRREVAATAMDASVPPMTDYSVLRFQALRELVPLVRSAEFAPQNLTAAERCRVCLHGIGIHIGEKRPGHTSAAGATVIRPHPHAERCVDAMDPVGVVPFITGDLIMSDAKPWP